jgi:hypothetical protein
MSSVALGEVWWWAQIPCEAHVVMTSATGDYTSVRRLFAFFGVLIFHQPDPGVAPGRNVFVQLRVPAKPRRGPVIGRAPVLI